MEWKDIEGWEGLYQVSSSGLIKSLPKGDGNGNRERMLKQEVIKRNATSYRRVSFSKNGIVSRYSVHRLVATTFIPNPENKPQVNHLDCNGENNSIENLEWVTCSENQQYSFALGRKTHCFTSTPIAIKEKAINRRKIKYNMNIGLEFGDWKIISIDGLVNTHMYVNCICKRCSKIHKVNLVNLRTGKTKRCRSCAAHLSWKMRDKDIV